MEAECGNGGQITKVEDIYIFLCHSEDSLVK